MCVNSCNGCWLRFFFLKFEHGTHIHVHYHTVWSRLISFCFLLTFIPSLSPTPSISISSKLCVHMCMCVSRYEICIFIIHAETVEQMHWTEPNSRTYGFVTHFQAHKLKDQATVFNEINKLVFICERERERAKWKNKNIIKRKIIKEEEEEEAGEKRAKIIITSNSAEQTSRLQKKLTMKIRKSTKTNIYISAHKVQSETNKSFIPKEKAIEN